MYSWRDKMNNLDKFYTKPEIAQKCVNYLKQLVPINKDDVLLEPSAGCGNFLQALKEYKVMAYDLVPEGENIIQQDFLLLESEYQNYITIGNPPFGKRSKLAIQFFNKAATMSKVIGFIIPNTFAKWSVQKHLNPTWKLIGSMPLPSNAFTSDGKDFQVNCIFQVWVREDQPGDNMRLQYSPAISCEDFECWQYNATQQAKKYVYEDWDYAFWRQGYNDYNSYFTKKDRAQVIDIVNSTNKQMFFVKCNTAIAHDIIQQMDLNELAQSNLSTPGFGKADFVMYFLDLKSKKDL